VYSRDRAHLVLHKGPDTLLQVSLDHQQVVLPGRVSRHNQGTRANQGQPKVAQLWSLNNSWLALVGPSSLVVPRYPPWQDDLLMLFDIPAGVTHYMEGIWVHYFISFFSFKTTYWQRHCWSRRSSGTRSIEQGPRLAHLTRASCSVPLRRDLLRRLLRRSSLRVRTC
jgi:hypothetical protein